MHTVAKMRTVPVDHCDLCGGKGTTIQQGLYDHMGNVDGSYTMRRCNNPQCRTLWLDPRPIPEELHLAYQRYYTHAPGTEHNLGRNLIANLAIGLARAPLQIFFQYRQRYDRAMNMFLHDRTPGRLLDVGCGSGARLAQLRTLGWQVQGQDVDPSSAAAAQSRGIPIFIGELTDANFPDNTFDAIISHHAIEHMANPENILRECLRILKPGGILTATTPNAESLGRTFFGSEWSGYDAPRHLRIFTTDSLNALAQRAGFSQSRAFTSSARADTIAGNSQLFADAATASVSIFNAPQSSLHRYRRMLKASLYYMRSNLNQRQHPGMGEECVLQATR